MDDSVTATPVIGDAFGRALLDALHGRGGCIVVERADGYVETENAAGYLREPADWSERDVMAIDRVAGRVLDVGAGAGCHSLALQAKGDEPLALDTSPGAIEVCRERGVRRTFLGTISALAEEEPEPFDAALLMGNNLGLLGSKEESTVFLDTLRRLLVADGLVVGTCINPYLTEDPAHLAYHQTNREVGRMSGHLTLRARYGLLATDWFNWLLVSPDELTDLAALSGWRVEEATEPQPFYLAVLRPSA